jgi:hypothetical protein
MSLVEFHMGFPCYMCRTPSHIKPLCDLTFNPMTAEYFLAHHLIRTGRTSKRLSKGGRVCTICYWPHRSLQKNLETGKCHTKQCASQEYPGHRGQISTLNFYAGSTVKHQHYNLIALVTLKIHYKSANFRLSQWWLWGLPSFGMWHHVDQQTFTNISGEHATYQLQCITSSEIVIFTNLQIFKISQYMC